LLLEFKSICIFLTFQFRYSPERSYSQVIVVQVYVFETVSSVEMRERERERVCVCVCVFMHACNILSSVFMIMIM